MKKFIRNALFGAAGLVALSLPAHAVGSATVADAPLVKSNTAQQQLAQRPYDPSAGSVGFKKSKKKKAEQQQRQLGPTIPAPAMSTPRRRRSNRRRSKAHPANPSLTGRISTDAVLMFNTVRRSLNAIPATT